MPLRSLIPDSKAIGRPLRRVDAVDVRELRKSMESGRSVVEALLAMSRAYLAEAQARLSRLEKETRPLRRQAAVRLAELEADSRPLRRQAARRAIELSYDVLERAEARTGVPRRPRRRRGGLLAGLVGLAAGVGIGYAIADRRSRGALQGGLVRIQGQARHRVPALVDRAGETLDELRSRWSRSSSGADEAALRASVEGAVKSGEGADTLEVGVEGRTVYLRGTVGERLALEGAIERARQVEGVAAVINLASLPSQGPSAGRKRG